MAAVHHGQHHIGARPDPLFPIRRALLLEQDRKPTALRHRVLGIEDEVEQRHLDLMRIGERGRQTLRHRDRQFHRRPDRTFQQVHHAAQKRPHIDRLDLQILAPREGEQALGKCRPTLRPLQSAIDQPRRPAIPGDIFLQQIEIAKNGHEEIVEIMRHATGQLADHLHLLRLAQLVLGILAMADLVQHGLVGLLQLCRPLRDPLFQGLGLPQLTPEHIAAADTVSMQAARSGGFRRCPELWRHMASGRRVRFLAVHSTADAGPSAYAVVALEEPGAIDVVDWAAADGTSLDSLAAGLRSLAGGFDELRWVGGDDDPLSARLAGPRTVNVIDRHGC